MSEYPAEDEVIPLDEVPAHGWCVVREVDASDADMERLMALGVCVGRTIELVMRGDPLIIRSFGSRIGVSGRLASRVRVSRCRAEDCPFTAQRH